MEDSGDAALPSGSALPATVLVPVPVRRDSSSSFGSGVYSSLPPGRYLLDFHGNCSRCNHHHSSVRVKVKIFSNPNTVSHVRCQRCHEKWLAIGGQNAAQISMLSVNTTGPDPREAEVRSTLVSMVRSATAIATMSPVLGAIPETSSIQGPSRQHSQKTLPENGSRWAAESSNQSQRLDHVVEDIRASPVQSRGVTELSSQQTENSTTVYRHGITASHHFEAWRRTLGTRFPILRRTKAKFSISKQTSMSARKFGKMPARDAILDQHVASNPVNHDDMHADYIQTINPGNFEPDVSDTDKDAALAQYLMGLAEERAPLHAMDEEQMHAWLRAKLTEFRARHARAQSNQASSSVAVDENQLQHDAATHGGRHTPVLFGLGSHFGLFDTFRMSNSLHRASAINISEHPSEIDTASSSRTVTNGQGLSWPSNLQQEQQIIGSPPQFGVPTWQLYSLSRYSADLAPSNTALRSASPFRDPHFDLHSQASSVRTSVFSSSQMSDSRTSIAS